MEIDPQLQFHISVDINNFYSTVARVGLPYSRNIESGFLCCTRQHTHAHAHMQTHLHGIAHVPTHIIPVSLIAAWCKSKPFSCLPLTIIWPSPLECTHIYSHTHTYIHRTRLLYNKAITIKAVRAGVLSITAEKLCLTHPAWHHVNCKHTLRLCSHTHHCMCVCVVPHTFLCKSHMDGTWDGKLRLEVGLFEEVRTVVRYCKKKMAIWSQKDRKWLERHSHNWLGE